MHAYEIATHLDRAIWAGDEYQFHIFANTRRNAEPRTTSELVYLETHCLAIVEYCFPNWRTRMPQSDRLHIPVKQYDEVHDICLKTLRCGGVIVDRTRESWVSIEGHCRQVFQERTPDYFFGWPRAEEMDPSSNHSQDPVWILSFPPQPSDPDHGLEWLEALDALRATLLQCNTMEEYCKVLEERGAKYYSHVEDSPEARQHSVPIIAWPTSDTWRTRDAMKSEQNLKLDVVETDDQHSDYHGDINRHKRMSSIFRKLFNK